MPPTYPTQLRRWSWNGSLHVFFGDFVTGRLVPMTTLRGRLLSGAGISGFTHYLDVDLSQVLLNAGMAPVVAGDPTSGYDWQDSLGDVLTLCLVEGTTHDQFAVWWREERFPDEDNHHRRYLLRWCPANFFDLSDDPCG